MDYFLLLTWKSVSVIFITMLASLVLFVILVAAIVLVIRKPARNFKYLDLAVFNWLDNHTTATRNRFMLFITFLGKHQFLVPANLCLLVFFALRGIDSGFSVRVVSISLSSLVLMLVLKQLFKRRRPLAPLLDAVRGLSFPSGHAIMAVTFYGLIGYICLYFSEDVAIRTFIIISLVGLILLIGFSRIYLRVHYMSDVVAGFFIGAAWLRICLLVLDKASIIAG